VEHTLREGKKVDEPTDSGKSAGLVVFLVLLVIVLCCAAALASPSVWAVSPVPCWTTVVANRRMRATTRRGHCYRQDDSKPIK